MKVLRVFGLQVTNSVNRECIHDEEVDIRDDVSNADVEDRPHNEEESDNELDVSVVLKAPWLSSNSLTDK
jgi:hypothetical protein